MSTCYSCNNPIVQSNYSKEHVIPNALGGRLHSRELLCKICNAKYGETIDAELCSQFKSLSSLLEIKKQGGDKIPTLKNLKTKNGETVHIVDGRFPTMPHPEVKVQPTGDGKSNLSIKARDKNELTRKLKELSKKYNVDVEASLKAARYDEYFLDSPVQIPLQIGGSESLRALAKIAINFFLHCKGERHYISSLVPYIKGEVQLGIVNPYFLETAPYELGQNEVVHVVHVHGNNSTRQLYVYVELFSTFSWIITLSNEYDGPNLDVTHCSDPLLGKIGWKVVQIEPPKEVVSGSQFFDFGAPEVITQKMNRLNRIIAARHLDHRIDDIIMEGIRRAFANIPEGEKITQEAIRILADYISMPMAILLAQQESTAPRKR